MQTEEAKIKLHSYFQLGVHYFKDKNYTAALQAFKNAIQTDSAFMPAKINYELCLQFLTQEKNKTKQTQQKQADSKNETTILDFIKEKEVQLWSEQSTEKTQKNAYDY